MVVRVSLYGFLVYLRTKNDMSKDVGATFVYIRVSRCAEFPPTKTTFELGGYFGLGHS